MFIFSLIHSFNKYSLCADHEPGTVLGTGETADYRTDQPQSLHFNANTMLARVLLSLGPRRGPQGLLYTLKYMYNLMFAYIHWKLQHKFSLSVQGTYETQQD